MTQEKWNTFTKQEQFGHISSDILRANDFRNNEDLVKYCMKSALNLTALTINDDKWKNDLQYLSSLHDKLTKMYSGESKDFLQLFNSLSNYLK